jgi:hypothetical protein
MKSSLTSTDRKFLIRLANAVDGIMDLTVSFTGLLPGFTTPEAQAQIFNGRLRELLKDFRVKQLKGQIDL